MTAPTSGPALPHALARAFAAVVRGLTYLSESDYPYKPFAAAFERDVPLEAEAFRRAAGIGRRYEITVDTAEQFFDDHIHPVDGEDADVPAYVVLKKVMEATLSDLSFIRVGGENVVHVRVYILGKMDDGNLSGLSTVSIET